LLTCRASLAVLSNCAQEQSRAALTSQLLEINRKFRCRMSSSSHLKLRLTRRAPQFLYAPKKQSHHFYAHTALLAKRKKSAPHCNISIICLALACTYYTTTNALGRKNVFQAVGLITVQATASTQISVLSEFPDLFMYFASQSE